MLVLGKSTFGKHHSNNYFSQDLHSEQKYILHSLKVCPYKVLITCKGENSNLVVGKSCNTTKAK